jgi:hypothetical protein
MALTIRIARGYTLGADEKLTIAALHALGLPVVVIEGLVGTNDVEAGAITAAVTRPGSHFYAVGAGTANALTANPNPPLVAHTDGALVFVKALLTNTAAATLNVNSLGAGTIRRGPPGALILPGDILAGGVYAFQRNGTYWHLLNPSNPAQRTGADNGSTADHITLDCDLPITALYTGTDLEFTVPLDVLAAVDLNPDGMGAKSIRKSGDLPLAANDLLAGQVVLVQYDASLNAAAGGWMIVAGSTVQTPQGILQIVRTEDNAVVTGTKVRAINDNPLLQSEVDLYTALQTAFTPKNTASRLKIEVSLQLCTTTADPTKAIVALFEGTATDDVAIAARAVDLRSGAPQTVSLVKFLDPASMSALTFRVGFATTDTDYVATNEAANAGENWGSIMFSSVCITEYMP